MKDTKVLLVSAIQKSLFYKQAPRRRALGDLGIRYIASYLIENGIEADILPSYDYTRENLIAFLESHPSVVAVGFSMHTISADNSLSDARAIKERFPHIKIWLGGFLPTFGWKFLLDTDTPFDYIMRGDGEVATLEMVRNFLSGNENFAIKGLIRRGDESTYNDEFCASAPIYNLPFPYFCNRDKEQNVGEYMISASRGCYGNCSFCSIPAFSLGRKERPIESVVKEMSVLKNEYGATFIDFVDDSFLGATNGLERAIEFSQLTKQENARLPYRISIRSNNVNDETLSHLKESGLLAVQLGVESFSPRQLKLYRKGISAERAIEAIRTLEKNQVYVQSGLILFEPSTTLEDLKCNARVLMNEKWAVVKGNAQAFFCAEGTSMAKQLKENGMCNLGVEGYLNYKWEYSHKEVGIVRQIIMEYEKSLGFYSNILVDAITPPSPLSSEDYMAMRKYQNEYQRLSFEVLLMACEGVENGKSSLTILEEINNRLGKKFADIIARAKEIIEEN